MAAFQAQLLSFSNKYPPTLMLTVLGIMYAGTGLSGGQIAALAALGAASTDITALNNAYVAAIA